MPAFRMIVALAFLVPWAAWAMVRLFGLDTGHPIVAAMAFTPFVAALAWLPVVVALALRQRVIAALGVVTAVALLAAVLPRAFGGARVPATANGPTLRVMSFNAYRGRADMPALLRLARAQNIDVLSLVEVTPEGLNRFDAAGGRTRFPGRALGEPPLVGGNAVLARGRLRGLDPAGAWVVTEVNAEMRVPGSRRVRITATHTRSPTSASAEAEWRAAIVRLPRPGSPARGPLRLLMGDFNATLDHHLLREVVGDGYVDAADATGSGLVPTWPRGRRRPPITLDHVLLDERLGVRSFSVHDVAGSDHRAVVAELVLPRG